MLLNAYMYWPDGTHTFNYKFFLCLLYAHLNKMNFINLFYSVDTIEGIECLSSLSASAVMTISCWLTDWLLLYTPRSTTICGQALHLRSASKRLREYHECYRVLLCIMALILSFLMTTTCIHNIRTAEEIWGMTEKKE